MSTATRTNEERAAEFVAAVRDRLSDLPRDEVDELTDGLAADLVDRLSDGNELGDPRSYAEELRQAAGLPERVEPESAPQPREGLMDQGRALASRWREWWDETSGRRGVRDFVLSLRSVWWVLRGVAVATVFCLLFGISSGGVVWLLVTGAATLLSVQWGRGAWLPGAWAVWLRRIGSVVAILALLPLAGIALDRLSFAHASTGDDLETFLPPGLTSNGESVTNIFAYDCDGQPLGAVQLFTQDGSPLHTGDGQPGSYADWLPMGGSDANGEWIDYRRNAAATMPDEWNVFPLRELSTSDLMAGEEDTDPATQQGAEPTAPYERVPVLGDCAATVPDEAASDSEDAQDEQTARERAESKGASDPAPSQAAAAAQDTP
ncbi:hypothetical protein EDF62_0127 [Leucobacter luti]|uniref:Uncharacterized protein n=1 Tax=Leucobacter luti TaxID=340320 RepID=A0A4R6S7Q6_9MICO|nr:hypothetical protein [Leucobacter luti]TDP95443.1 hypothetical protein EDF62_0127 [Leucobacter luti]